MLGLSRRNLKRLAGISLAILVACPIGLRIHKFLVPVPHTAIYQSGLRNLTAGQLGGAQLAAEALSLSKFDPRFRITLEGGISLRMGRLAEAVEILEPALNFPETAATAHFMTGEALYKNRQFRAAVQFLSRAVELDDSLVDAHRLLAAVYYDLGSTSPALRELAKVAKLAPGDYRPHRLAGLIYKDMESFDAAIGEYRSALKTSGEFPERHEIQVELAECLLRVGRHQELRTVLDECRLDQTVLRLSAELNYALGDHNKARELVKQSLEMEPTNFPALLLTANLQTEAKEPNEAVATLRKAVDLHPREYEAHHQLSRAYARIGETELAQTHAAEAARLRNLRVHFTELHSRAADDASNPEIRYELGIAARDLGMKEIAISWFSACLSLDRSHANAAKELETLTNASEPSGSSSSQ